MITRRRFLKYGAVAGAAAAMPWRRLVSPAHAVAFDSSVGYLSDPALQPKFATRVPNALHPDFIYRPDRKGRYKIQIDAAMQPFGLLDQGKGGPAYTKVYGYGDVMRGDRLITSPGRSFEILSTRAGGAAQTEVFWQNALEDEARHLLPVDESLHWCFSLHGISSANGVDYRQYSIAGNGVPIITHLHGGHSDFQFDGNPEFFYTPDERIRGPQWDYVPGGFTNRFYYDNEVPAGNLWYHDHALGITRLNVYAGLAGFYFVRDANDPGARFDITPTPLGEALPKWPYEMALAIQDRMFTRGGALFYPAFPNDPAYADFITGEGAMLPPAIFPGGGPTALAEFFGDHLIVNNVIWPYAEVEPRHYRLRLLNGCDSRFMGLRFRVVDPGEETIPIGAPVVPFRVIGADQGFASAAQANTPTELLVFEPGSRYDVLIDFSPYEGQRVILENIGGDAPFGGGLFDLETISPEELAESLEEGDLFEDRQTDRIMAFDLTVPRSSVTDNGHLVPDYLADDTKNEDAAYTGNPGTGPVRRVALFEGMDEYGRLQPLLGTVEDDLSQATPYAWFQPTTETPTLGTTETWEIYNFTADAHPIHLHLVNFQVLGRQAFTYEVNGVVSVPQHSGGTGTAEDIHNIAPGGPVEVAGEYKEDSPRDMVVALPGRPDDAVGQVTRIKATFDKPGRYVWHCHILSHEDHEMMRVLEVRP